MALAGKRFGEGNPGRIFRHLGDEVDGAADAAAARDAVEKRIRARYHLHALDEIHRDGRLGEHPRNTVQKIIVGTDGKAANLYVIVRLIAPGSHRGIQRHQLYQGIAWLFDAGNRLLCKGGRVEGDVHEIRTSQCLQAAFPGDVATGVDILRPLAVDDDVRQSVLLRFILSLGCFGPWPTP